MATTAASPAEPLVAVPPIAWKTLACVSLVGFMASIEITIISLALPDIRAAFAGQSESLLSWVFNGYNITVAALLLPAGWVSDRFGRRNVFCAGVLTFAVGSLLAGLAPSLEFLVAARVLQAVGGAFQVPAGMALLLSAFPAERRHLGIGIWGATSGLAAAFGPTAGALLVDLSGWRAVFLINVPVALAILAISPRWLLADAPDTELGRVDLVAVPLAAIGVGAAVFAIVQGEEWGWTCTRIVSSFILAVLLIGLFVCRSYRHPRPLFDLSLFRLRSFWVGSLGQTAFVAAFFLWLIPFPTYLRAVWGWSVLEAGFAIAPGPLTAMIVAPISGKVTDSIGPRTPLVVSGLAGAAGISWQLNVMSTTPDYVQAILIPSLFIGIAAGIAFPGTVGAIVYDVKPRRFAMAGAARSTLFQLSLAIAIALAFSIIGRPASPDDFLNAMQTTWALALCLFLMQALLFFALFLRRGPANAQRLSVQ